MILVAGEILFDLFPDSRRIGGAPFNFSYHLKRLGQDVRFVSRVGQDELGDRILDFLTAHGFDTGDIQVDPELPTGRVDVIPHSDGGHEFAIAKNAAYDRLSFEGGLAKLALRPWQLFYTGTLIQRSRNNARVVRQILDSKPAGARCFCDINLRPECYTRHSVRNCLAQADILKLSDTELDAVAGESGMDLPLDDCIKQLVDGYSLEHVIYTKGSRGSRWYTNSTFYDGPVPDESLRVKDTVGAGDAYAAIAAAGILNRLSPEKTILLAQEFAGRICEIEGAIPDDSGLYPHFKRRLIP